MPAASELSNLDEGNVWLHGHSLTQHRTAPETVQRRQKVAQLLNLRMLGSWFFAEHRLYAKRKFEKVGDG